jgi:TonB family protein
MNRLARILSGLIAFGPIVTLAQVPQSGQGQQPDLIQSPQPGSIIPPRQVGPPHICAPGLIKSWDQSRVAGPTMLAFKVTTGGTVTDITVEQSSGDRILDYAAMTCAAGWLYTPAMKDGRPVETHNKAVINWSSSHPPVDSPKSANVIHPPARTLTGYDCEFWHKDWMKSVLLGYYVEPDGSVKNVTILQSSGDATVDKDAADCITQRTYKPATKIGKPVEVRLTAWLYPRRP